MHAPDNEISPCEAGKRAGNSYSVKYSLMERGSTLLHVSFTIKQLLEYSRAGGVQFEGLSELPRGYQELDRPVFKRLIPPSVVAKTNQLAIQKMLKCPKTNSARVLIRSLVGVLYGSVFFHYAGEVV